MTEAGGKLRARLALPYRRTPALVRSRRNAICPAWSSAAPSPARCEPIPAFLLILACAIASARPWNIRRPVEHRGAHQAPFYARGLSEIIAVSENAPGAHGAGPAGVDGADGAGGAGRGGWTQEGANGDWCGSAVRLSDRSSEDEDSTGGCLREGWEPGRDDVDLSGRAGDGIGWNR